MTFALPSHKSYPFSWSLHSSFNHISRLRVASDFYVYSVIERNLNVSELDAAEIGWPKKARQYPNLESRTCTIWEGDPGHLRCFGLLAAITSTSLKVYGAHGVGAHPRNNLSLVGAILDMYSSLSEFISGGLPKRGINWLPGHPCKPELLTVAAVLQCIIRFKGH
jgi:hypothetical protein